MAFDHHIAMTRGVHDDGFIRLLHIVIENLLGAVLVKYELMIADADNIAVFEPVRDNQVFIDKGTVFTLQVRPMVREKLS
jgi:hypothetical protein